MQNKFTMLIEVNGQFHNFQFVDSPQGHYTISLVDDTSTFNFRVFRDVSGQYKIDPSQVVPSWAHDIEPTIHDYIELGKHFFTNQTISIFTNGHSVVGELNGSSKWWTFKSEDRYFLSLFPEGRLASFSMFFNPIPSAIEDIYNRIYEAIDAAIVARNTAGLAA